MSLKRDRLKRALRESGKGVSAAFAALRKSAMPTISVLAGEDGEIVSGCAKLDACMRTRWGE
eukprot:10338753-Alexandrium_andersonii.AAC.1